jgi:hypothetical protein
MPINTTSLGHCGCPKQVLHGMWGGLSVFSNQTCGSVERYYSPETDSYPLTGNYLYIRYISWPCIYIYNMYTPIIPVPIPSFRDVASGTQHPVGLQAFRTGASFPRTAGISGASLSFENKAAKKTHQYPKFCDIGQFRFLFLIEL